MRETTRDVVSIIKYQINQEAGYDWYRKRSPFATVACWWKSILEAVSVSCFMEKRWYSRNYKNRVLWQVGIQTNPTATEGGLLGFMLGKRRVEKAFWRTFANKVQYPSELVEGFPNDWYWHALKSMLKPE